MSDYATAVLDPIATKITLVPYTGTRRTHVLERPFGLPPALPMLLDQSLTWLESQGYTVVQEWVSEQDGCLTTTCKRIHHTERNEDAKPNPDPSPSDPDQPGQGLSALPDGPEPAAPPPGPVSSGRPPALPVQSAAPVRDVPRVGARPPQGGQAWWLHRV